VREQAMDKRWRSKMNKELASKRADEEVRSTLSDWGQVKARVGSDISLRNERAHYVSDYSMIGVP
jgi:hypothetical protein